MRMHTVLTVVISTLSASAWGQSQEPYPQEPEQSVVLVQAPAPQPRPVPATPAAPTTPTTPAVPTSPRISLGPNSQPFDLASAGTTARPIELPNMYGDLQLFRYSPYLQALTPNGQLVTILPGQSQQLPTGTILTQTISDYTTLTRDPNSGVQVGAGGTLLRGTPTPTDILVDGPPPRGNAGGLPVPVIRGAYKITENEGPRPTDRAYIAYNYFYDVNPAQRRGIPGLPITNVHRQTFGIEKTFLGGDASIGLRLPLIQISGPTNLDRSTVGDLSVILKYAIINNPFEPTADGTLLGGEVLSTGIVITAPTGGSAAFTAQDPIIHPTLFQPFVGAIKTFRRAYTQYIGSIAVPTDDRDTVYMFNSLQLGYLLYQDTSNSRFVRSATPIAELHVNTPFNNRDVLKLPIGVTDIVSLTFGTSFGLGSRSSLNLGTNVPISGPRVYALETIIQLNVRY